MYKDFYLYYSSKNSFNAKFTQKMVTGLAFIMQNQHSDEITLTLNVNSEEILPNPEADLDTDLNPPISWPQDVRHLLVSLP